MLKAANQTDFRIVIIADGTETYAEMSARDCGGSFRTVGAGRSLRRAGDTRNEELGISLALSRALTEAARVYADIASTHLDGVRW